MKERLQKLLAQASIASRRASEALISAGRVRVNGEVAKLGDKADPDTDTIEVDGRRLNFASQSEHVYIALNKPKQVLSTDKPHRGDDRETVSHLIRRKEHLFSIGRLDADSEGLIVMTNDGALAERLSHPRYRHTKTYRVDVLGLPSSETLEKWQRGVTLEDGQTAPCFVEIAKGSVKLTTLRIVMTEGKKRQIRRVAALLGHPVRKLVRTHIGMYALGDLQPGQTHELTAKDVIALRTPSPEIKDLRATRRRNPADHATPEAEEAQPKPRARKPAPAAEAETDAPSKRRSYRSRDKSHDDQWGKPTSPRKPATRAQKSASVDDTPPKPRSRKPAPAAEDTDTPSKRKPAPRAQKSAPADNTAPKRKPYRSRDKSHDDQWGKPSDTRKRSPSRSKTQKPGGSKDRKPSSRKDRSS